MSVLVSNRNQSRVEVIAFSETLHDMLDDLMCRNFGIKDTDAFVRSQYAHGKIEEEDFAYYRFQLQSSKKRISDHASRMTNCLRAAYHSYPTSPHEYEVRRDYQNDAMVCCEMIVGELQRIVNRFNVDINIFAPTIKAIDQEIGSIKNWRQLDGKRFKSLIKG